MRGWRVMSRGVDLRVRGVRRLGRADDLGGHRRRFDDRQRDWRTAASGERCGSSDDCLSNEVCVEGFCGDTDLYYFDVRVHSFAPASCSDGWGTAEVYFSYVANDELQATSSSASCPASWSEEALPTYDSLHTFELRFWELDAFEDDLLAELCWRDVFDGCDVVPKTVLHEGGWAGYTGANDELYLDVTFTPLVFP